MLMWKCEANAGQDIMSNGLTRFLGDTPGRTALKLLVASFVVGVVMAAFNWYPVDMSITGSVISVVALWEKRIGQPLAASGPISHSVRVW
jgi:hypothetical protein